LAFISSRTLDCEKKFKIDSSTIIEQVARKLICCSLSKINELKNALKESHKFIRGEIEKSELGKNIIEKVDDKLDELAIF
jgi:hypothetical protein